MESSSPVELWRLMQVQANAMIKARLGGGGADASSAGTRRSATDLEPGGPVREIPPMLPRLFEDGTAVHDDAKSPFHLRSGFALLEGQHILSPNKRAGLVLMPGGIFEIFADGIVGRKRIGPPHTAPDSAHLLRCRSHQDSERTRSVRCLVREMAKFGARACNAHA